jgi:hypothetical protein
LHFNIEEVLSLNSFSGGLNSISVPRSASYDDQCKLGYDRISGAPDEDNFPSDVASMRLNLSDEDSGKMVCHNKKQY